MQSGNPYDIQTLRSERDAARVELTIERLVAPLLPELVENASAHEAFRKELRLRLGVNADGEVRTLFGEVPVEDPAHALNAVKKECPFFFRAAHEPAEPDADETKPVDERTFHQRKLNELQRKATKNPSLLSRYIAARTLFRAGRLDKLNWNSILNGVTEPKR